MVKSAGIFLTMSSNVTIGRIAIIKSLVLSQMTYLFSVLPNQSNDFIKKIEQILFKFIWNGKSDKVKREMMHCSKEASGVKMTNILFY